MPVVNPLYTTPGLPSAQGLYDPSLESDACGVGFVVNIDGIKSHQNFGKTSMRRRSINVRSVKMKRMTIPEQFKCETSHIVRKFKRSNGVACKGSIELAYDTLACYYSCPGIFDHLRFGSALVLRDSQIMLERMEHRGACGCDNDSGDGAGVLTGIPHELFAKQLRASTPPVELPDLGKYATGIMFMDFQTAPSAEALFEKYAQDFGLQVLCWRTVPVNREVIGKVARALEPLIRQTQTMNGDVWSQYVDTAYISHRTSRHEINISNSPKAETTVQILRDLNSETETTVMKLSRCHENETTIQRRENHSLEMKEHNPEMKEPNPEMSEHNPEMREHNPEMREHNPEMRDHRPGAERPRRRECGTSSSQKIQI
ncbi:hypothetical protein Btru_077068 [Bulinus truncatus]|nr:hypothetical protein Btru_077068 [Bulinus truncatus]